MIANKDGQYYERLHQRRGEILRTLDYLSKEKRTLDENRHSIDGAAYESRCHLLDSLVGWYANETTLIDNALIRMREVASGVCSRCRQPIDLHRLPTDCLFSLVGPESSDSSP
jgi:RNA polymerase-binding transcription factor DksA